MEIAQEDIQKLKDILKMDCLYECGKFNRYCSNDCTCGKEYQKLMAFEEFAESLINKHEGLT